jgi:release factor glutamine methyltransferase
VGRWEFFNLEFEVTPDVLIPRPETELLVERAIAWLKASARPRRKLRVLDVGTGSGCIAISLAANIPGIEVVATDISSQALSVARRNAQRLLPSSLVTFVEADLFPESANQQKYNLVVANLPYIPGSVLKNLPVARHEPGLALDGGADGLDLIRRLLKMAPGYIEDDGLLLLEIEASQGEKITSLAKENFPGAAITLLPDLSGKDRLVEIRLGAPEGIK